MHLPSGMGMRLRMRPKSMAKGCVSVPSMSKMTPLMAGRRADVDILALESLIDLF